MKRGKRILIAVGCLLLLLISWASTLTMESASEKQKNLLAQAEQYLQDEIFILSVPLLEEAAGYDGAYTAQAEEQLKLVYRELFDQSGYRNQYEALLTKQMARANAGAELFQEAAEYYLEIGEVQEALSALRDGIERTGSPDLEAFYESQRYAFVYGRAAYEDVTALYQDKIQVSLGGKWGLADATGTLVIPCTYDRISTYSMDRVIVQSGDVISAIDLEENRLALLHVDATGFNNLAENRLAVETADGWIQADSTLTTGKTLYEAVGMYQDGRAAASQDGKWGVIDPGGQWVVAPEHDSIIMDEMGRCWSQNAVFVKDGDEVHLLVDGEPVGDVYEDAQPFAGGYAAVQKDGLWGFIDTAGRVQIPFQFEQALSFGEHLAAVCQDGLWGYVSLSGEMAIAPQFLEAKSFSGASAPVLTNDGWQFITLVEYQE